MAGNIDDFIIYDEEFQNAYTETLAQQVDFYNEASRGCIVLTSKSILGNFEKMSFFKSLASASLVEHRDPSGVGAITAQKIEQGEKIGVKLNRRSYIQNTLDSFKKIGTGEATFSQEVGILTAMASAEDQFNTGIATLAGGLQVAGGHAVQGDGLADIDFTGVNALRFAYGDNFNAIKVLIMHSATAKAFVDLNIAEKLDTVAGVTIQTAQIASLGIPILITDSPSLGNAVTGLVGANAILALTENACLLVDSEAPTADVQRVQGSENLTLSMQREWAFNVSLKGISYTDVTVSPTNAQLATPLNWTKTATDKKHIAGVMFDSLT